MKDLVTERTISGYWTVYIKDDKINTVEAAVGKECKKEH